MAEELKIVGKVVIDSSETEKSINRIKQNLEDAKKIQAEFVDKFGEASPEAKAAADAVNKITESLNAAINPATKLQEELKNIDVPKDVAINVETNVEPIVAPEVPSVEPINIDVNVADVPPIEVPSVEPILIETEVEPIVIPEIPQVEPIIVPTEVEPIEVPPIPEINTIVVDVETNAKEAEDELEKLKKLATDKNIKVNVDPSNAAKSISELKQSLDSAKKAQADMIAQFGKGSKEAKDAAAAVALIEQEYKKVNEAASGVDAPVKSLKQQLREANNELIRLSEEFGPTSKEAANAAKRVAELKDRIGDAKLLTDAFNPDAKFKGLSNAIQGAVGAFSALQGAQALFGTESEKLQETLVKVQGAMALSQGLNSVMESKDAFIALGTQAKAALAGIRTGIAATGIGVLLIALGAIVAYWDDIKTAVGGVSGEQRKQAENAKKLVEAEQKKLSAIDEQSNTLKLQGKSERDILQLKLKQYDQVIAAAQAQIKIDDDNRKREQAATERNAKLLKSYLDFVSLPLNYLYKTFANVANSAIDLINKIPGVNIDFKVNDNLVEEGTSYLTKALFDPEETKKEGEKARKESEDALNKLQNDRAGAILQMQEMDKEASEKSRQEREKNNQIALETQKIHQEAMLSLMEDGYIKQKELLDNSYEEQLAEVNKQLANKELTESQAIERRKALEEKYNADLLVLQKQEAQKRQDFLVDLQKRTEKVIQDTRLSAIQDGFTKQQILVEQNYQAEIDALIEQQDKLKNQYNADKDSLDILLKNKQISQEQYNQELNRLNANLVTDQKAVNNLRLETDKQYEQQRLQLVEDNNKKIALSTFNEKTKELEEIINSDTLNFEAKRNALDAEQKLLEDAKAKGLITEKEYTERNKKFAEERTKIGKAEVENRKAQIQAIGGLLNGFAELLGKQTKAGKAAAIAGLLIEQGQNVANIITNTQAAVMKDVAASPLTSGLPWAAIHVAQGALGVATSVKAVKKGISDIKNAGSGSSEGGSAGSVSAADVGTAPAPVPPLPPQAETTAIAQDQINQLVGANAAVKAYVVESDVTDSQERITRLNRAARIS